MVSSSAIAASKSLMVESIRCGILSPSRRDVARQFAVFELHVDALAFRDGARIADDRRAIRVPAHGVAAAEHRQRAQALEARRRSAQARVGAMHAPLGG